MKTTKSKIIIVMFPRTYPSISDFYSCLGPFFNNRLEVSTKTIWRLEVRPCFTSLIALVEINDFLNTKFLKLLWRREIALAIGIGIFYFCFVFTKRYIHIISVRVQNKYWRCVRFNF